MTQLQNSVNANSTTPLEVIQGGTGLASTTANQILYSSGTNTIAGLATAGNGVLITSSGGAPSISSTLPTAVQGNITETGTVTTGNWSSSFQDYTEITNSTTQTTAFTLDPTNGNVQTLTMAGNVTITISGVPASNACSITLFLVQDSTGSRIPTFPASVIWPGGTAPTFTTTANYVDMVVLITTNAGTTWRAASILNYSS